MAAFALQTKLRRMIADWAAVVVPIAARDPAAFYRNDVDMPGLLARLNSFIRNPKWDDALVIRVTNSDLSAHTAWLNQVFGTRVSAPQFQAPAVTPLATFDPLTPEQVATFGTGVELAALDPALVEAAAALAPESEAAKFVAQRILEPPAPPPEFEGGPLIAPPAPPIFADVPPASLSSGNQIPIQNGGLALPLHGDIFRDPGGGTTVPGGDLAIFGVPVGEIIRGAIELFRGEPLIDVLGFAPPTVPTVIPPTPITTPAFPAVANGGLKQKLVNLLIELSPFGETKAAYDVIKGVLASMGFDVFGNPLVQTPNGALPLPSPAIGVNGCAIPQAVTSPVVHMINRAPKGYVMVTCNGQPVAMLKSIAKDMGYWKRRPKPPMSASEWKTLRTAKRVTAKSKRIAQTAGFKCSTGSTRRRKSTC